MTPPLPELVLVDRDGVLIEHVEPYVLAPTDVRPIPGALDAVGRLLRSGIAVAVVTNQSVVGRGLVPHTFVDDVHAGLARGLLAEGLGLPFFVCPHRPDEGCHCRKPAPGLLVQAMEAHGAPAARTWMVGDHGTDLQAALAAGCAERIHVSSPRQPEPGPLATMAVQSLTDLVADLDLGGRRP